MYRHLLNDLQRVMARCILDEYEILWRSSTYFGVRNGNGRLKPMIFLIYLVEYCRSWQ